MKRDGAARSRAFAAEVSVSVPRAILRGDLAVPAGAAGLVVFAHGSGSSRKSPRNQFVAEGLRAAGMGTLLMDLLTPEEEAVDRVRGHLRFDIAFLAERLLAATDWARHQDAAARSRSVTSAPRPGPPRLCSRPPLSGKRSSRRLARWPAGSRGPALPRVAAPTLLIVGGADAEVLELNREALARLRCEKGLRIVPGASHLFPSRSSGGSRACGCRVVPHPPGNL